MAAVAGVGGKACLAPGRGCDEPCEAPPAASWGSWTASDETSFPIRATLSLAQADDTLRAALSFATCSLVPDRQCPSPCSSEDEKKRGKKKPLPEQGLLML